MACRGTTTRCGEGGAARSRCDCSTPPRPTQVNHLLEVGDKNQGTRKYTALDKWATQLKSIHTAVQNKLL